MLCLDAGASFRMLYLNNEQTNFLYYSNLCWFVLDFIHLWDKVQKMRGVEKKCHGFNEMQLNYLSCSKFHQIEHWFIWPEASLCVWRRMWNVWEWNGKRTQDNGGEVKDFSYTALHSLPGICHPPDTGSHLCMKSDMQQTEITREDPNSGNKDYCKAR